MTYTRTYYFLTCECGTAEEVSAPSGKCEGCGKPYSGLVPLEKEEQRGDDELLARLMEEMKALPRVAMVVTPEASPELALGLSPEAVWAILASLQLALKHPGLQDGGATSQKVRSFLNWIRLVFIPPGSAMEEVFQRGFDR